ncbi:MAG: hypothetical protein MK180_11950 [Rhodobacteraceae bacterium]|nr:hypothetical protein [Paracoccaceae bacterium]
MSESPEISGLCPLRRDLVGCELAVLADLSSETCLLTSAEIAVGQERFDTLCKEAAELLRSGEGNEETLAVTVSPMGTRLFIRDTVKRSEALCLLFSPTASLDGVEERGRAYLQASE